MCLLIELTVDLSQVASRKALQIASCFVVTEGFLKIKTQDCDDDDDDDDDDDNDLLFTSSSSGVVCLGLGLGLGLRIEGRNSRLLIHLRAR